MRTNIFKNVLRKREGFTIVELLIVVVVIAILASITIVSYNGIQGQARQAKIESDLALFETAIIAARTATGSVTGVITGSFSTGGICVGKPNGTDLAQLPKTDVCWTTYTNALQKISDASGIQIQSLVDPWGRPYMLDENETEGGPGNCTRDYIKSFSKPFLSGWNGNNARNIVNVSAGC